MSRVDTDEPVTVVFSWRAKSGREEEFARWADGATGAAVRFQGNLGATVIRAEGSRDFHIIMQFANRRDLDRWFASEERSSWLGQVPPLADARTAQQERTGLETWFHVPSHATATMRPPPRWKMWLISLLAVYPLVLAIQAFVMPLLSSWPLPAKSAVFPVVVLTLMTYVVMPGVTRVLRPWL